MTKLREDLVNRVTNVEGVRPAVAPIPEPGIYWFKRASCGFYWIDADGNRLDRPSHNEIWAVYTWDLITTSDWFIGEVDKSGSFYTFGSDEDQSWEGWNYLVTQVGPKIEAPE